MSKDELTNVTKKPLYKQWWFWTIIVLAVLLIVSILATPTCKECPACVTDQSIDGSGGSSSSSGSSSQQGQEQQQQETKPFEAITLSGTGVNVTDNISLPSGTYTVAYSFDNNLSSYGSGTNFAAKFNCGDHYDRIANLIEASGNGTKVVTVSSSDTCFIEVEMAAGTANWSFIINKK